jgi:hypothetical protein
LRRRAAILRVFVCLFHQLCSRRASPKGTRRWQRRPQSENLERGSHTALPHARGAKRGGLSSVGWREVAILSRGVPKEISRRFLSSVVFGQHVRAPLAKESQLLATQRLIIASFGTPRAREVAILSKENRTSRHPSLKNHNFSTQNSKLLSLDTSTPCKAPPPTTVTVIIAGTRITSKAQLAVSRGMAWR